MKKPKDIKEIDSKFEKRLSILYENTETRKSVEPISHVCDTADIAYLWLFERFEKDFTASDCLKLTEMILKQMKT